MMTLPQGTKDSKVINVEDTHEETHVELEDNLDKAMNDSIEETRKGNPVADKDKGTDKDMKRQCLEETNEFHDAEAHDEGSSHDEGSHDEGSHDEGSHDEVGQVIQNEKVETIDGVEKKEKKEITNVATDRQNGYNAQEYDGVKEQKDGVKEQKYGVKEHKAGVKEQKDGVKEHKAGVKEQKDGVNKHKVNAKEQKDGMTKPKDDEVLRIEDEFKMSKHESVAQWVERVNTAQSTEESHHSHSERTDSDEDSDKVTDSPRDTIHSDRKFDHSDWETINVDSQKDISKSPWDKDSNRDSDGDGDENDKGDGDQKEHVDGDQKEHVDGDQKEHVDGEQNERRDGDQKEHVDGEQVQIDDEQKKRGDDEQKEHVGGEQREHGDDEDRAGMVDKGARDADHNVVQTNECIERDKEDDTNDGEKKQDKDDTGMGQTMHVQFMEDDTDEDKYENSKVSSSQETVQENDNGDQLSKVVECVDAADVRKDVSDDEQVDTNEDKDIHETSSTDKLHSQNARNKQEIEKKKKKDAADENANTCAEEETVDESGNDNSGAHKTSVDAGKEGENVQIDCQKVSHDDAKKEANTTNGSRLVNPLGSTSSRCDLKDEPPRRKEDNKPKNPKRKDSTDPSDRNTKAMNASSVMNGRRRQSKDNSVSSSTRSGHSRSKSAISYRPKTESRNSAVKNQPKPQSKSEPKDKANTESTRGKDRKDNVNVKEKRESSPRRANTASVQNTRVRRNSEQSQRPHTTTGVRDNDELSELPVFWVKPLGGHTRLLHRPSERRNHYTSVASHGGQESCFLQPNYNPAISKQRLVELSRPKEKKNPWIKEEVLSVMWGNQELLNPIPSAALNGGGGVTERLSSLAKPKAVTVDPNVTNRDLYYYSAGRPSQMWSVNPKALSAEATPRLAELAHARCGPGDDNVGRGSMIWDPPKSSSRYKGDAGRINSLAAHKEVPKDFKINRDTPATIIPPPALKTQATTRLEQLATAKCRPETAYRDCMWEVPESAKRAQPTERLTELARTKPLVESFKFERPVISEISPSAKKAQPTGRVEELASPIVRQDMESIKYNPDAFKVKPTALTSRISARVEELAQPMKR